VAPGEGAKIKLASLTFFTEWQKSANFEKQLTFRAGGSERPGARCLTLPEQKKAPPEVTFPVAPLVGTN